MARPQNPLGQAFRCPVCGAEVTVIQGAPGELAPRCCNQPMVRLPGLRRAFRCPVCGAEIIVVKQGPGPLEPHCCNQPMAPVQAAA